MPKAIRLKVYQELNGNLWDTVSFIYRKTCLDILEILRTNEINNVNDITNKIGTSQSQCSLHLSCLAKLGLIYKTKKGRDVFYHLHENYYRLVAAIEEINNIIEPTKRDKKFNIVKTL